MSQSSTDSKPTCPYCGGDDLVDGMVRGHHRTRFKPTGKKWSRPGAEIHATACLDCGGLWLWVERSDVEHALGRPA